MKKYNKDVNGDVNYKSFENSHFQYSENLRQEIQQANEELIKEILKKGILK